MTDLMPEAATPIEINITLTISGGVDPQNIQVQVGSAGQPTLGGPLHTTAGVVALPSPVLKQLQAFENFDPTTHSRQHVQAAVAMGFIPTTAKSGGYVRLTYKGTRSISVYVNSAVLIFASQREQYRAFAASLPGADTTAAKDDIYFRDDDAFVALDALKRYADGEDGEKILATLS